MFHKVRDLRLGDILADGDIKGRVIGLRLDDRGQVRITFIATRESGELFEDVEIRAVTDLIELASAEAVAA